MELQLPGTSSMLFLFYLLVFLPWAAIRSARRFHDATAATASAGHSADVGTTPFSRERIWIGIFAMQAVLLILSWITGADFGYRPFATEPTAPEHLLWAAGALAVCFGLRAVLRASRTEEERRGLAVFRIAPRTARESAWWAASSILAGIAEELAYRGVAMSILWYSLGNPWVAALISAIAFSLAHWLQGWKSGATIFLIALTMHGLVALTGTLVWAIAVHAIYDLVAGHWIRVEARRFDAEAAAVPDAGGARTV